MKQEIDKILTSMLSSPPSRDITTFIFSSVRMCTLKRRVMIIRISKIINYDLPFMLNARNGGDGRSADGHRL